MIDFRRSIDQFDIRNRTQRCITSGVVAPPKLARLVASLVGLLHRAVTCGANAAQRNALEVLHRHVIDQAVRILNRHHVVVAALRIDPITRCDHAIGGHGGNHILHHILGGEADQAGLLAVDVQRKAWVVNILRNINAAHIRHRLDLLGEFLGKRVSSIHVHRADLDVDRRRQTLIDNTIHQAASLEIGG